MHIKDVVDALEALKKSMSKEATIHASVFSRPKPIMIYANPNGRYPDPNSFHVEAADWPEAIAEATAKWDAIKANVRADAIRRMALEIIKLTVEHGECTDRALRCEAFTTEQVDELADEACVMANEMAARGPFVILRTGASNQVAAE